MSCTTDRHLIFTAVLLRRRTRFVHIYQIALGCDLLVAQLFCRLNLNFTSSSSSQSFFPDFEVPYSTPFTTAVATAPLVCSSRNDIPSPVNLPALRTERTALLISSTSWTVDEDFGLLLETLEIYNRVASAKGDDNSLPRILVVITGKGPLKDMYMSKVQRLQHTWDFVRCISAWLDALDYPLLLGCSFFLSQPGGRIDELQSRVRRRWNMPPYQFIGTGFTHEDCRHVRVRSSCVCAGFFMVSLLPEFRLCPLTKIGLQPSRACTTRLERADIQITGRTCGPADSMLLAFDYILRFYSLLFITEPFAGVSSFSNIGNVEICLCQIARLAIIVICSLF